MELSCITLSSITADHYTPEEEKKCLYRRDVNSMDLRDNNSQKKFQESRQCANMNCHCGWYSVEETQHAQAWNISHRWPVWRVWSLKFCHRMALSPLNNFLVVRWNLSTLPLRILSRLAVVITFSMLAKNARHGGTAPSWSSWSYFVLTSLIIFVQKILGNWFWDRLKKNRKVEATCVSNYTWANTLKKELSGCGPFHCWLCCRTPFEYRMTFKSGFVAILGP